MRRGFRSISARGSMADEAIRRALEGRRPIERHETEGSARVAGHPAEAGRDKAYPNGRRGTGQTALATRSPRGPTAKG